METPTVEALAALLAVLQMSLCAHASFSSRFQFPLTLLSRAVTEVQPMKTRPLLRSAVSHYKDLQDAAANEAEAVWIRKTFGFAIYVRMCHPFLAETLLTDSSSQTADCLISAYARRKCHIADSDLPTYFAHADTKIILPRLPMDSLLPIAQKLVAAISSRESALKSAKHLLACWVCACQRAFVQFAAREPAVFRHFLTALTSFASLPATGSARKTAGDLAGGILQLWSVRLSFLS